MVNANKSQISDVEGQTNSATPQSLKNKSTAELDHIFDTLPSPESVDLDGVYRGEILISGIFDLLPGRLPGLVKRVAGNFWRAKSFGEGKGANVWFRANGPLKFAAYKTGIRSSASSNGDVIAIDYDIPNNPGPLKNIHGEARQLGPGTYLARMRYRLGDSSKLIMYFTLQQQKNTPPLP